jgi:uncharacterized protein (TIGR03382 family)
LASVLWPAKHAIAEVESVEVEYVAPFGTFGSRDYVYVEGVFNGTADGAEGTTNYRVPYVLIYPTSDPVGFGVVDLPNAAFFEQYPRDGACQTDFANIDPKGCPNGSFMSPCETRGDFLCVEEGSIPLTDNRYEQQLYQAGRRFTEAFFFEQGYTYLSVMYHRTVTEHFGPNPPDGERRRLAYGTIERAEDANEIIRDAGRFLRDPSAFDGGGLEGPAPVSHALAYGFSSPGCDLQDFVGTNQGVEPGGGQIFDGYFIHGCGSICKRQTEEVTIDLSPIGGSDYRGESTAPTYVESAPCAFMRGFIAPPTNGAKVFNLNTTSEMLALFGAGSRRIFSADPNDPDCAGGPAGTGNPDCDPDPNYMSYEIAGASHLPADILDTSWMGTPAQNPADMRPAVRALFHHLHEWVVNDTAPPLGPPLEGNVDEQLNFLPLVDADQNPLGGIRLPFMPRYGPGGEPLEAGAPLGSYGALDLRFLYVAPPDALPPIYHLFSLLSGTFLPFSNLAERYPDGSYGERVRAAAQLALDEGFILQEDFDRYVAGLGEIPDPDLPPDPEQTPPETGCGCSAEGSGGGAALTFIFLLLSLLAFRRRERTAWER